MCRLMMKYVARNTFMHTVLWVSDADWMYLRGELRVHSPQLRKYQHSATLLLLDVISSQKASGEGFLAITGRAENARGLIRLPKDLRLCSHHVSPDAFLRAAKRAQRCCWVKD